MEKFTAARIAQLRRNANPTAADLNRLAQQTAARAAMYRAFGLAKS